MASILLFRRVKPKLKIGVGKGDGGLIIGFHQRPHTKEDEDNV
jgi:hypothetical protein